VAPGQRCPTCAYNTRHTHNANARRAGALTWNRAAPLPKKRGKEGPENLWDWGWGHEAEAGHACFPTGCKRIHGAGTGCGQSLTMTPPLQRRLPDGTIAPDNARAAAER
jgi:hypothetical protein